MPQDSQSVAALSIIVPAFNEEGYIGQTLDSIIRAREYLAGRDGQEIEIIVVNNGSTDRTAKIFLSRSVLVLEAPQRNVATARNAGARAATGDILVFVDADTLWPEALLWRIVGVLSNPNCIGGAVDTEYRPARFWAGVYLGFWRVLGNLSHMAQGGTQFCRTRLFWSLGG